MSETTDMAMERCINAMRHCQHRLFCSGFNTEQKLIFIEKRSIMGLHDARSSHPMTCLLLLVGCPTLLLLLLEHPCHEENEGLQVGLDFHQCVSTCM